MKKTLSILAIVVVVAIAGGVYYLLNNLDSLVKQAIEKYGSQATHTSVSVNSVRIKLKQGSAAIAGITVANPKGFSADDAFSLGKIAVRVDYKHSSKKHITIDEVKVLSPEVFYEVNADRQGNLNILKDNIAGKSPSKKSATSVSASQGAVPTITIGRFEFAGGALHAKLVPLNNKQYNLDLPSFTLRNLHGTPQQISKQVMNQLIDHARAEIKRKGIDAALENARNKLKQKADAEKAKLKQNADTRLQQEKQKAQDKLKNLLGK